MNLTWASLMMEELARLGVRHICVAPGSRSSPLAVAAARHPRLHTVVHFDERGGAFYALGLARASGVPAVWVTTSGTAAANGFPAVVEASMAGVPLLLITADRPPELRDAGANQTIDQVKMFGDYVRWQVDMPCPSAEVPAAYVLTTVDQAVQRACSPHPGPVHLNCMFREPLLPEGGAVRPLPEELLPAWQKSSHPYTTYMIAGGAVPPGIMPALWRDGAKGLIVAGELRMDEDRRAVCELASHFGWPLLPDVLSGLRLGAAPAPSVPYYDQLLLADGRAATLRPDVVLHVGGPIVSRRLQQFLAVNPPPTHVRLSPLPTRQDPQHQVTLALQSGVAAGCDALRRQAPPVPDPVWAAAWIEPMAAIDLEIEAVLEGRTDVNEPWVARTVSRLLPAGHGLFLASSMPIRDMDMYGATAGSAPGVGANRGASGIDGTLATAAGFAAGLDTAVTVVLGDLACLHDLNSLALLRGRPVTVIVINNNGGGIFSFLPVAAYSDVFEKMFGTPHGLHFESAAALFGLKYIRAETQAHFQESYAAATRTSGPTVIEVVTDRDENVRLHAQLQQRIRSRLSGPGG